MYRLYKKIATLTFKNKEKLKKTPFFLENILY